MRFAIQVLAVVLSSTTFAGAGPKTGPPVGAGSAGTAVPADSTTEESAAKAPDHLLSLDDGNVHYGIDLRLRSVHLPQTMMGWFVARGNGSSNIGLGIDFVRRRGNLELQFGVEYEHINLGEGVFIQNGTNVPSDTVDYILSPAHAPENFGWLTFEFTFLYHKPLTKYLAFRYGAGLGLGVFTGGLYRWDVQCAATATIANAEPGCIPGDHIPSGTGRTASDATGAAEATPVKYDLPPVFPVVNAIVGLQFKPHARSVVNVEIGIRTLPFFGMSAGYFF